jgi:hypothetical protein
MRRSTSYRKINKKSRSRPSSIKRSSRKRSDSRGGKVKLVKIIKSPNPAKKYQAIFSDGTKTNFGAAGMSDYTKHKDPERRKRYMARHKSRENWKNFKSPGSLSYHILWNKPSFKASVSDYKRKFGL